MANLSFVPPVLDIIISTSTTSVEMVTVPGAVITRKVADLRNQLANNIDGNWVIGIPNHPPIDRVTSGTVLAVWADASFIQVGLVDTDWDPYPSGDLAMLVVTFPSGSTIAFSIDSVEAVEHGTQYNLSGGVVMGDGSVAPGEVATLNFGMSADRQEEMTTTTITKHWASRLDFPARDILSSIQSSLVPIKDSRYTVRESGLWAVGSKFTDEQGEIRTVRGISKLGRGFLELLARDVG